MTRIVVLVTFLLSSSALAAGEPAPPAEPPLAGIYAAGTLLCPLAELNEAAVLSRPDPSDEGLPVLLEATTSLAVVTPTAAAQQLGVRPRELRLVRKMPDGDRHPYTVVAATVERDAADQESFRLAVRAPLAPGSYRFGLERPDVAAGTEIRTVIRFLPCGFIVSAPAAAE